MAINLGVNIDHVATLRQARGGSEPDPVLAASLCEAAGADSIVAHLREDRRHIQDRDIFLLKEMVKTKFNLEMSLNETILTLACKVKPGQVTIVPEKRQELTTEGGLNVLRNKQRLKTALLKFKKAGIAVSLFIDPDKNQIDAARSLGVSMIELHTGRYAEAKSTTQKKVYFQELKSASFYASEQGFSVFAGHGLDYKNVDALKQITEIEELNIGYSIICRSVIVGLEQAVREMKYIVNR
ncbi:MAG: pyridoxine 5'-phosphate synthase [Candidatus Omnitrophota bacterium]|jgi:pyridoxine 5-phosphate synthase